MEDRDKDREVQELATQYREARYPYGNTPSGFARYVIERVRRENDTQKKALVARGARLTADPRVQKGG